jgi:hypothetical protein
MLAVSKMNSTSHINLYAKFLLWFENFQRKTTFNLGLALQNLNKQTFETNKIELI